MLLSWCHGTLQEPRSDSKVRSDALSQVPTRDDRYGHANHGRCAAHTRTHPAPRASVATRVALEMVEDGVSLKTATKARTGCTYHAKSTCHASMPIPKPKPKKFLPIPQRPRFGGRVQAGLSPACTVRLEVDFVVPPTSSRTRPPGPIDPAHDPTRIASPIRIRDWGSRFIIQPTTGTANDARTRPAPRGRSSLRTPHRSRYPGDRGR